MANPAQAAALKDKRYDTAVGLLEANIVGGRRAVREKVAEILEPDTLAPNATETHDALLTLGKCRDGRTRLITTNFDQLFEHVIEDQGLSVKRFEAPLLPVPKKRWDGLVYLHGLLPEGPDPSALDNLVVSSGDFGLAYLTERWAARFVSELLRNFVVCFVGYSIEDPVLRYMMDALAADRQRGEAAAEMFAFGSFSGSREDAQANEWKAKNVTPILYRGIRGHTFLHGTLRAWADTYRDGARGKERIVVEYAMARPDTATGQDDFVSRMKWALSDPSGRPAMRFADLDPVPSLDWLEPLAGRTFVHEDLIRFGVPPKVTVNETRPFSLTRRPAPYDLAPQMSLADSDASQSRFDDVMVHLARWLTRHLADPNLLLWLVKQGGRLDESLAQRIAHRMDELARMDEQGEGEALDRIRSNAPNAIPDRRMRVLWNLLLAERVRPEGADADIFGWARRFNRDGLTTSLRLELRELLSPQVSLRDPFPYPFDDEEEDDEPPHMRQLVDWDIVVGANDVDATMRRLVDEERWTNALQALLPDLTGLLRDALDLMRELEGADDKSDLSYSSQPSISEHEQNRAYPDWTALIDLNRDAWLATADRAPERARFAAESWSRIPYPLFRRLSFFAACRDDVIPRDQGLAWLLADDGWWLWSIETRRETMRLLVALAPRLDREELAWLERAILTGPPREMYRDDLDEERWGGIQDRDTWLRLAKLSHAGAELNPPGQERLEELSARYLQWQLAENDRDEFPTWTGDGSEFVTYVQTPRERDELIEWLRANPEPDEWKRDDWRERCRDDFENAAAALATLAEEECWPVGRWREALQAWSGNELTERSWREMAPVVERVPAPTLQDLDHSVSSWLEELARTFEEHEETFFALCDRVLALDHVIDDEIGDALVGHAINHPVGNVTKALIQWWYRSDLKDGQGLADEPRRRFTELCDANRASFRHGRVLLAGHVISLFRVDRDWTTRFMLPLFDWGNSAVEARSAWQGFLSSPRLYGPLMEVLKPAFLDTANHYRELARQGRQYASLLTFVGLDPGDVFRSPEVARAFGALPQDALEHAATTLVRAVGGAGDQRAEYWRNRAARFLRAIWPKTPDVRSGPISESFSRGSVAAGDAFPEAFGQIEPWLQTLRFPDRIAHAIHEAGMDTRFPERALELLHRVFHHEARGYFPALESCLRAIRAASVDLERDDRFERLREILRTNGRELV